ncbi:MAG: sugar ABC transporter substrate-binding protein [Chloroflexi bacterium]|nr:sugar ABC transporter substrate-binding protein [Chloroflexota bacterium]
MVLTKWFRPVTLLIIVVMIGGVVLAACGPSQGSAGSSQTGSSGQVTIKYWDWWVTQGPTIDNEIKLFEQAHPNIKIEKTTQVYDKYADLVNLAMKGGTPPDVLLVPDSIKLVQQVKQGWYLPLNKWADKTWQSQYPANSFAEASNVFGGKIYTAPYEGQVPFLQLYINTKVFKDAGLVDKDGQVLIPKTWDEVRADAEKITQSSGGKSYGFGFGDQQRFILPRQLAMVQQSGAPGGMDGFDMRTGRYTWASNPAYLDWINFFMGMKQDGSILPNALSMDDETSRVQFADGKFGMLVGGVWIQGGWQKTNPDFKDYAVAPLPYQGPDKASYWYKGPGGQGWAISAKTQHPEEAWLWFQWLNSKEAAERWVKAGQGLRVFPEVNKLEYAPTPQFAQYMKLAEEIKLAPSPGLQHPEMAEVREQTTMPNLQGILEGVYTGQITDAKSALKDLEGRMNAELDRAIKDTQSRGVNLDPKWWVVKDWDITKDYAPAQGN